MATPTSYFVPGSLRDAERSLMLKRLKRPKGDIIRPNNRCSVERRNQIYGVCKNFITQLEATMASATILSRRTRFAIHLQLRFAQGKAPSDASDPELKDWNYDAIRQFRITNEKYNHHYPLGPL